MLAFRAAVNSSLGAAGKTSCFSRPVTQARGSPYHVVQHRVELRRFMPRKLIARDARCRMGGGEVKTKTYILGVEIVAIAATPGEHTGEQHCCERPDRSPGWIAARQDAEATRPGRLDRRIALKWFYRRASKWMLFWSAAGATFLSERHHSRSRAAWTYETYGELTCH